MAEGEELPPVVIPLEGDDSGFLEMLDRDVEALKERTAEMGDTLTEGLTVGAQNGADRMVVTIGEGGTRAASALQESTAAFDAAGEELGAAVADGAAAAVEEAFPSLAQRMRAGMDAVLAEWEAGTKTFTDAQLATFQAQFQAYADAGDEIAAASLDRVRALAGETVAVVEATAAQTVTAASDAASAVSGMSEAQLAAVRAQWDATEAASTAEQDIAASADGAAAAVRQVIAAIEEEAAAAREADAAFVEFAAAGAAVRQVLADINRESGTQQFAAGPGEAVLGQWAGSDAEARAAQVRTALEGTSTAAADAGRSMGGLAGVMNGPLGFALWNIPFLLYGAQQMLGSSAQATQAYQQQLQSLGGMIAQDGNMIGANTEAALANQIAYQGLGDLLSHYGVSLTQATEAASGVTAVQETVNASLTDQTGQLEQQIQLYTQLYGPGSAEVQSAKERLAGAQQAQAGLDSLAAASQKALEKQNEVAAATLATEKASGVFTAQVQAQKLAMDQAAESAAAQASATLEWLQEVTPGTDLYNQAVWESLTALKAQAQQADITAAAQREYLGELVPGTQRYTAAVNDQETALEMNARTAAIAAQAQLQYLQQLVPGTQLYTQALDTQRAQLLANGAQSALTTIAQLNLGDATSQFQIELTGILDEYQQTTTAASGYTSVLNAMNSTTNNLLSSEASFTIALSNVTQAVQQNGTSLDINTDKGALNIQAFTGVANAAQKAAEGVYQSEVQTKGATTAFNDANRTLEAEKNAFIAAADKAGFNKQAVQQLADELYKLPPDVTVNVHADPTAAKNAVAALIYGIDTSTATITVREQANGTYINPGSGIRFNASGGPGYAGVPQVVGDGGQPELFVPDSNGYTFPSIDAGLGALGAYAGGGEPTVVVQVLMDGVPVAGGVRHSSQYYKNRNATTGFS